MPADMPSDMSSARHCMLMAVWGEDDARVPARVLYAYRVNGVSGQLRRSGRQRA